MNRATPSESTVELRARIGELRREVASATQSFYSAKADRRAEEVTVLLRKRTALVRELIQAQSELLSSLRARHERSSTPVSAA